MDDVKNDPSVTVTYYSTVDLLQKDSAGGILPWASYRPSDTPHYGAKAKGKIVDGHVIAEPVDARLPLFGNNVTGDMIYKGLRLDLDLTKAAPDGSYSGLLAGYRDFENWWDYIRKIEFLTVTGQWSCPAIWVASQELADGYPDPKTGKCTAISEAMDITAVPAFVVPREARTAQAQGK